MALTLSLVTSESNVSVNSNTSDLTVKVNLSWTGGSWDWNGLSKTLTIDDTTYNFSSEKVNPNRTTTGSQTIYSRTKTIAHNSDGSRTVNVSAKIVTRTESGTVSSSKSVRLTTIARATQPSVSPTTADIGDTITISCPRKSSSFTHNLSYTFGSESGTIETGAGTSKTWTLPKSLADNLPTATTGTLKITCVTKNGNTTVGTKTCTMKVTVPNTTEYKPSINGISTSELSSDVKGKFTVFVKGKSSIRIAVDRDAGYGTSVKQTKVTFDGRTYTGATVDTSTVSKSGSLKCTVSVTDNRSRVTSKDYTISVVNYYKPSVKSFKCQRCNSNGTANDSGAYFKATYTVDIAPVSNQNKKTAVLRHKKQNSSSWTEQAVTLNTYNASGSIVLPADTESSYNIEFEVTDTYQSTKATATVSTVKTLVDYHSSGTGIAFGKVAEKQNTADFDMTLIIKNVDHTITEAEYNTLMGLLK